MTNPILNDTTPYLQYVATSGQTIFPYTWLIYDASNLRVWQKGALSTPDDTADLLQLGVDYTVDSVGVDSGGNVTLVNPASTGDIITVAREMPLTRMTEFTGANVTPDTLNLEFDNILAMVQDLNMYLAKIIPNYNFSAIFNIDNMKLPQLGPNQLWQMNSLGTGIQTVALTETDPGALILRADLASTAVGKGGSLVSLTNGQTVQQFADSIAAKVFYGLDTSVVANTVTVNFSPALESYQEGQIYIVRIANTNTGATTIDINGLGSLPLLYVAGQNLFSGDIHQYRNAVMTYVANNGSSYIQLLNPDFETQIANAGIRKALTASVVLGTDFAGSAGISKIPFNTVRWDDNSFWDATNVRFVLVTPGKYRVSCTVNKNSGAQANVLLYLSGSNYINLSALMAGYVSESASTILNITSTTYVELYIDFGTSSGTVTASVSVFQIEYLGSN